MTFQATAWVLGPGVRQNRLTFCPSSLLVFVRPTEIAVFLSETILSRMDTIVSPKKMLLSKIGGMALHGPLILGLYVSLIFRYLGFSFISPIKGIRSYDTTHLKGVSTSSERLSRSFSGSGECWSLGFQDCGIGIQGLGLGCACKDLGSRIDGIIAQCLRLSGLRGLRIQGVEV